MDSSLIIVLVVVIALGVIVALGRGKNQARSFEHTQYDASEEEPLDFPYAIQNHFLSPAELSYFQTLRRVVGNRAVVSAKVGLGDVFWVKLEDKSQFRAYRNKIDRKHVDFLLCDPATMNPLVGIELDDSSHQREDRRERDAFVDQVFAAAKLPLLHIPAQRGYVVEEIAAQIAPYLGAAPASTSATASPIKAAQPAPSFPSPSNAAPRCPKCGSEMVLRTAKTGANAGNRFWGCSTYPSCRGMMPYTE